MIIEVQPTQTLRTAPAQSATVPGASLAGCADMLPCLAVATVPDRRRMLRAARETLALDDRRLGGGDIPAGLDETRSRIRALRLLFGRMKRVLDVYEKMYAQQPLLAFLLMPGIDAMLAAPGSPGDPAAVQKAADDCAHYFRQGVPLARELGAAMRMLRSDPCHAGSPPGTRPDPVGVAACRTP